MSKVGNYIAFKKKTNKSSKNYRLEEIANYNLMKNYDYKLYVDTIKNNADIESRLALDNLKKDIENGIINKVVVRSISNISRNIHKTIEFMKFLKKYDCELESMKEGNLHLDDYDRIIIKEKNVEEENVK